MSRWACLILAFCLVPVAWSQTPSRPRIVSLDPEATAEQTTLPSPENLVSLDPDRAEVLWADRRWQLVVGNVPLKDFDRRESEARAAVRLIRDLRLTQRGVIGHPAPVLEYWLSEGRAPRGPIVNHRVLAFEPALLKVETSGGQWFLSEGSRTIFRFGHSEADARQALAVIRKYRFNRLAIVGQAAPSMLVFLCDDTTSLSHRPDRMPVTHQPGGALAAKGKEADKAKSKDKQAANPIVPKESPAIPVTPVVAPLRDRPQGSSSARIPFAGGSPREFARGRQLGAEPPPPNVRKLADRVAFDWRAVEARRAADGWQLAAGDHVLARFGEREAVARQALEVLRSFHLTEQMAVGPTPYFSYFLVEGRPPRGVPFGVDARAYQVDGLIVREVEGQWCICDYNEPLLRFGAKQTEARDFLALMRKERLDRLVCLGSANTGMTILARSR